MMKRIKIASPFIAALGIAVTALTGCQTNPGKNLASQSVVEPGMPGFSVTQHETRTKSEIHTPADQKALQSLYQYDPMLYELYFSYPGFHAAFKRYAYEQGYRSAEEKLGIALHEIIHVVSADQRAFWIDGTYHRPYVISPAGTVATWGSLTFKEVAWSDKDQRSALFKSYIKRNPDNHLGNLIDELNAYTQSAGYICQASTEVACERQAGMIKDYLRFFNSMVKSYKNQHSEELDSLKSSETGAVVTTVIGRSLSLLKELDPSFTTDQL